MTTGGGCVAVDQVDAIRWLSLNRPEKRNALDDCAVDELRRAIALAEDDDTVSVIVLAGAGPSFCAGADLAYLSSIGGQEGQPVEFLARVSTLCTELERCPKPTVAALHGHVVAGGLELALACDIAVCAEGTLIGDGHLRNRLLPAGGASVRLPRKLGSGLARRLMLTGELLPADAFLASGWICALVSEEELANEVERTARSLSAVASASQRAMKSLLNAVEIGGTDAALREELHAFAANWSRGEPPAAIQAFLSRTGTQHAGDEH